MSTQPPAQNTPYTSGTNDSGEEQPLRTRYYPLIMTAMVVIGIVIDIAILIGIYMNTEGSVRVPFLIFIVPVAVALGIGRFADAALAKKSPHLVRGHAAPYFQGGQAPQQGQYGQPAAQPMAPQSAGYGQVPGQQAAQTAPQQAPHGQPQQPGQVPPSGQYGQTPQNQQPYGQGGQTGPAGPAGY